MEKLNYKIYSLENEIKELNEEMENQREVLRNFDFVVNNEVLLFAAEEIKIKMKNLQEVIDKLLEKGKILASLKDLRDFE